MLRVGEKLHFRGPHAAATWKTGTHLESSHSKQQPTLFSVRENNTGPQFAPHIRAENTRLDDVTIVYLYHRWLWPSKSLLHVEESTFRSIINRKQNQHYFKAHDFLAEGKASGILLA